MKVFITTIIALAAMMATTTTSVAQVIYPGEELVYRVSYLNITLGTVKCVTEPYTTLDGKKVAKVKVYIQSHPNIPFVSLQSTYESWMDTSATFSHKFNANTKVEEGWEFDQYLFDYTNKKAVTDKYRNKARISGNKYDIKRPYNDGSSILYAARALMYSKKSLRLPTLIMEDTVSTVINFSGKKGTTEIDAVDYPVKTVYINGDANWTGVYGLSGRFEGWFSDDDARIPILAKMKVYVGAATLELTSWKRGSWAPPRN